MSQYSFLITGASSGLGLQLTLEALRAGHLVVAGARNPTKASRDYPEVQELGGSWLELDVTRADTQERVAQVVEEKGINVLINNAGHALLGSLEDTTEEEFISQFNTNTFGTMRCTKGVLPHFRSLGLKGGATIVNIGSFLSLVPFAATAAFAASKGAVDAMSEALSAEVGPLGVRVVLVDLGVFRTSFLHSFSKPKAGLNDAYVDGPADTTVSVMESLAGHQPGNPQLAAKRIVEIVDKSGMAKDKAEQGYSQVLRVPMGSDSFRSIEAKLGALKEESTLGKIACSTDFAAHRGA